MDHPQGNAHGLLTHRVGSQISGSLTTFGSILFTGATFQDRIPKCCGLKPQCSFHDRPRLLYMADTHPQAMEAHGMAPPGYHSWSSAGAAAVRAGRSPGWVWREAGGAEREGKGGQEKRDLREINRSIRKEQTREAH